MKFSKSAVAISVSLILISLPLVGGVIVKVNTNDVSFSGEYSLADKTTLLNKINLLREGTVVGLEASGTGENSIQTQVGGLDYQASSNIDVDGAFRTVSSFSASRDGSIVSSSLNCDGSGSAAVSGSSGSNFAGQQASVLEGNLVLFQDLWLGRGIVASQDTSIDGYAGVIASFADSSQDLMVAEGGFVGGDGELRARLDATSFGSASGSGFVYINGVNCVDPDTYGAINSIGGSMYLEGLSRSDVSTGRFSFTVTNSGTTGTTSGTTTTTSSSLTSLGSDPEIVSYPGGSSTSYVLNGKKINQNNPLQLYLKTDSYLTAEGLTASSANSAIALAANTWDYWTKSSQNNLFVATVINDASKSSDAMDGYSVSSFVPISGTALAYAKTYTDANGYVIEADVNYNSNYDWTASSTVAGYDLQTVALHELGHVVGLGDLYTLPADDPRKTDYSEIMNCYTHKQHNLGAGDIKGLQSIYGV